MRTTAFLTAEVAEVAEIRYEKLIERQLKESLLLVPCC
jgi:hypothetical protein